MFNPFNPYFMIGAAVALVISFGAGWTVHGWKVDSGRVAAIERDVEKQATNYSDATKVEAMLGDDKAASAAKTQTIIQTVTKYVRSNPDYCGLRADGVRVFDAGRTGQPLPAADKPDGPGAAVAAP